MIPREALIRFLLEAKRRTYAAQGDEATVTPLLPGSKQLEYEDGSLLYRDVYLGFTQFSGLEVVYEDGGPVWAMAYAGGMANEETDARAVYALLRAALRQVEPALPFRGPPRHIDGRWVYTNSLAGDVARFTGAEAITLDARPVYALSYSGGLVR